MPTRNAWITGNEIPSSAIQRCLCIPDDPFIVAAVVGALFELTRVGNWEQVGTVTPENMAAAMLNMWDEFNQSTSKCMPVLHQPIYIRDDKTQNTAGGTFTSGAWRKRTLNTLIDAASYGASLSSDEFTLPAGKWLIKWRANAFGVNKHQSRLYEVTGASVVEYGTTESVNSTSPSSNASEGIVIQDNTSPTAYRIEHQCQTTLTTEGFGRASNFGPERYCEVECYPIT